MISSIAEGDITTNFVPETEAAVEMKGRQQKSKGRCPIEEELGDVTRATRDVNEDSVSSASQGHHEKALTETMSIWAVSLVVLGILLSLFLVALDRTIVSTAIPEITDGFNSLEDFGWYGSAYLLACCAVQLLFGKLSVFFPVKSTLLLSILTFAVASAICGAASNSGTLIAGRAIAGLGAAGIFTGAMTSMIRVVPLHHKPKLFAALGSVQVLAQIGGPILGGALTTHLSWRWCFYINLPVSGAAMLVVWLFFELPQQSDLTEKSLRRKMKQLDVPEDAVFTSGATTLLERLPKDLKDAGLVAYNDSLRSVSQMGLGLSCVCIPAACALEWRSVQAPWAKKPDAALTRPT